MRVFNLRVAEPLSVGSARLDWVQLDPDLSTLIYSSQLPGGFNSLQIGLRNMDSAVRKGGGGSDTDWGLPTPFANELLGRPFSHLQLYQGSALCFEGRIMRTLKPGGQVRGFYATGYGISATTDQVFVSGDTTARTSGVCLAQIVAQAAPLLTVGTPDQFVDPGVAHALADFTDQTPAQVLQQLISEGGNANAVWDYLVYEGRVLQFLPRIAPVPAQYRVPFDTSVDWQEDYSTLYGGLRLKYTSSTQGLTVELPATPSQPFADRYGVQRIAFVSGSNMTDAGAASYQSSYLAVNAAPTLQITLTRDENRGLELTGGGERPPWDVRAGEWIAFDGLAPLPIVRAEYNAHTGIGQYEVGAPSPRVPQILQALRQTTAQIAAGINARTGAKTY